MLFQKLGFDQKWISRIMSCVGLVTYTMLMNGQSYGHIKPGQGDLLSPFLFILCADALVHVMNKAEKEGRISGMSLARKCPSIQHLLFADDRLFVCWEMLTDLSEFLRCLRLYCSASD